MQIFSTYHQIHNGGQLPRQWELLRMSTHDSFPLSQLISEKIYDPGVRIKWVSVEQGSTV